MNRNFKFVAFGLFGVLLVLLLYMSFVDKKEVEKEYSQWTAEGKNKKLFEEANRELSKLVLLTLEGKEVKLSDYRGKVLLVNFWASWCPPCKEEMPLFERVYQKYKEKDFLILAVNTDTSESALKGFLQNNQYSFPILRLKESIEFNIPGLPTSYLIDRDGSVKKIRFGVYRELEEDLSKLLQQ